MGGVDAMDVTVVVAVDLVDPVARADAGGAIEETSAADVAATIAREAPAAAATASSTSSARSRRR